MSQQQNEEIITPQNASEQHQQIYGEENVNMKNFVVGTIVGGVVGAAAALLLAPKPGRELRGEVATQAVTLKDKGIDLSAIAKEKSVQLSSQLKDQSIHLVDKVKAKVGKAPATLEDSTVSIEGEESIEISQQIAEEPVETIAEEIELTAQSTEEIVDEIQAETSEIKEEVEVTQR